jgi:hypothetical protein
VGDVQGIRAASGEILICKLRVASVASMVGETAPRLEVCPESARNASPESSFLTL